MSTSGTNPSHMSQSPGSRSIQSGSIPLGRTTMSPNPPTFSISPIFLGLLQNLTHFWALLHTPHRCPLPLPSLCPLLSSKLLLALPFCTDSSAILSLLVFVFCSIFHLELPSCDGKSAPSLQNKALRNQFWWTSCGLSVSTRCYRFSSTILRFHSLYDYSDNQLILFFLMRLLPTISELLL